VGEVLIWIELAILLAWIAIGSRLGGVGLGAMAGLGLFGSSQAATVLLR